MLPICFLSDYGRRDEWVGVCHGVMLGIAPGASVIDVAHDLPPMDVRHAAFTLENAAPFLPSGVLIAVVDPGVGTKRRAIAARTPGGMVLVGPDNGLLWPAAQTLGGIEAAVDVAGGPFCRQPVSATFHGRDVFAPVAAHLALGAALEQAGTRIEPSNLMRLEAAPPQVRPGGIDAEVRLVDRFGNLQLQARPADMDRAGFAPGDRVDLGSLEATYGRTFADAGPGGAVVYEDSSRWIAVAINGGSAAERLGPLPDGSLSLLRCAS